MSRHRGTPRSRSFRWQLPAWAFGLLSALLGLSAVANPVARPAQDAMVFAAIAFGFMALLIARQRGGRR